MVRRLVPFGARRGSFAVDLVLALHGLDADIDFSFGLPLPCGLLELSRNKDCLGVLPSPDRFHLGENRQIKELYIYFI